MSTAGGSRKTFRSDRYLRVRRQADAPDRTRCRRPPCKFTLGADTVYELDIRMQCPYDGQGYIFAAIGRSAVRRIFGLHRADSRLSPSSSANRLARSGRLLARSSHPVVRARRQDKPVQRGSRELKLVAFLAGHFGPPYQRELPKSPRGTGVTMLERKQGLLLKWEIPSRS